MHISKTHSLSLEGAHSRVLAYIASPTSPLYVSKLRWPWGIMGFTCAFWNLQGKFSTAIATLNFQPRFNFLLFQLPQRNRYFQRSTAIQFFNAQLRFQLSTAIQFFNAQLRFQLSTAIQFFNAQLRFQLSTAIRFFNAQLRLQLSTAIATQPRFNFSTLKCDCNFQPRFDFSTLNCDSNFQVRGTFSTPDSDYYRSILLMVKKLLIVNKISMIFKTINVNYWTLTSHVPFINLPSSWACALPAISQMAHARLKFSN